MSINNKQIAEFMELAKASLDRKDPVNVCFSGPPGLGKSALVEQWATSNGYKYLDVRLAQMEAPDVRGIQREIPGTGRLQYLLPNMWPETGKVVINLDELNRAPRSNMNAVLSILQERRIGELTLSPEAIIVSCINEGPEYDVSEMDPAIKDRLLMVPVEYDHNTFLSYAEAKGFHPNILGFLKANIWVYRTPAQLGEKKYMANRSWTRLNSAYTSAPDQLKSLVIKMELGTELAKTYENWLADNKPLLLQNFIEDEKAAFKILETVKTRQDLMATLALDMSRERATKKMLPLYGKILEQISLDLGVQVYYGQLKKLDHDPLKANESPVDYVKKNLSDFLFKHTKEGFRDRFREAVKGFDMAAARS